MLVRCNNRSKTTIQYYPITLVLIELVNILILITSSFIQGTINVGCDLIVYLIARDLLTLSIFIIVLEYAFSAGDMVTNQELKKTCLWTRIEFAQRTIEVFDGLVPRVGIGIS